MPSAGHTERATKPRVPTVPERESPRKSLSAYPRRASSPVVSQRRITVSGKMPPLRAVFSKRKNHTSNRFFRKRVFQSKNAMPFARKVSHGSFFRFLPDPEISDSQIHHHVITCGAFTVAAQLNRSIVYGVRHF